jgi:TPR repeat protein
MRPNHQSLRLLVAMITLIAAPYLAYAGLSVEEVAQFKDLLTKAERGDRGAQELVAIHYELGTGTSIDLKEAAHWFRTAAGQDSLMARFRLGTYYLNGKGVEKDPTTAVIWLRKAAKRGHAAAQIKLGECYESGNGVPKDLIEAYAFYTVASIINLDGPRKRDEIKSQLTKPQLESAQRRAISLQKEIEEASRGK